jgi:hypothetical protein
MNKQEYNGIVFTGDFEIGASGYVKYRKISNREKFIKFIEGKYPLWVFINLYDRKTNEKECIKKNRLPVEGSGKVIFLPNANINTLLK